MTAPARRNSKPRTRKTQSPFHWFRGPSVRQVYDQLTAANPDTARLEVRIDKAKKMTLRVVGEGIQTEDHVPGHPPPDTNESHVCPPDCP